MTELLVQIVTKLKIAWWNRQCRRRGHLWTRTRDTGTYNSRDTHLPHRDVDLECTRCHETVEERRWAVIAGSGALTYFGSGWTSFDDIPMAPGVELP